MRKARVPAEEDAEEEAADVDAPVFAGVDLGFALAGLPPIRQPK